MCKCVCKSIYVWKYVNFIIHILYTYNTSAYIRTVPIRMKPSRYITIIFFCKIHWNKSNIIIKNYSLCVEQKHGVKFFIKFEKCVYVCVRVCNCVCNNLCSMYYICTNTNYIYTFESTDQSIWMIHKTFAP